MLDLVSGHAAYLRVAVHDGRENLSKLQAELRHSDIQTTRRYAKMAPDFRTEKDRALLRLLKVAAKGKVLELRPGIGSNSSTEGRYQSK